jgi:cation-transporting ATPase 13A3/4/5
MSVICKNEFDNKYKVFVKGSPEKISELCQPGTLPENFNEVMSSYTKEGYRVIALAFREMGEITYRQIHRIERDAVESNLTFLGLLIMENKLKVETIGVIRNLNECRVRTIMATGDNVLTAISVAR